MYKFKSYEEQFILFTLLPYRFTSRLSKMCLCMFVTFKFLFNVFCVRAKEKREEFLYINISGFEVNDFDLYSINIFC